MNAKNVDGRGSVVQNLGGWPLLPAIGCGRSSAAANHWLAAVGCCNPLRKPKEPQSEKSMVFNGLGTVFKVV